ncbi:MAG TPA: S4 domain-containing protein [Sphingomicrobium sp.]|nr:S4 domain-containing protein [Sphingomicrobium sp.]
MRIDRYLHRIRLAKSRALAQGLVDTGLVRIDGKRVTKASEPVRIGSIIALPLCDQVRVLRVLALPERRGPAAEARACYQELGAGSDVDGETTPT